MTSADDEIQEVSDSTTGTSSNQDTSLDASTSSIDDPDTEATQKNKITCPICMDDEKTVSTSLKTLSCSPRLKWFMFC